MVFAVWVLISAVFIARTLVSTGGDDSPNLITTTSSDGLYICYTAESGLITKLGMHSLVPLLFLEVSISTFRSAAVSALDTSRSELPAA